MSEEFEFMQALDDEAEEQAARKRRRRNLEHLRTCWPDWEPPTEPQHLTGVRQYCSVGTTCAKREDTGEQEYQYGTPCRILEIKDDARTYRVAIDYAEDEPEHCTDENGVILLLDVSEIWAPVDRMWMIRNAELRIQTHHAPHCEDAPWIAMDMNLAAETLEGYDLTDEEKNQIPAIMAGYCRLLDEADIIGYGKTKDEAMAQAAEKSQEYHKK